MADYSRSSESSDSDSCSEDEKVSPVPPQPANNLFKNDGSFLEMFKKMQDKKSDEAVDKQISSSTSSGKLDDSTHRSSESSLDQSSQVAAASKKSSILSSVRTVYLIFFVFLCLRAKTSCMLLNITY